MDLLGLAIAQDSEEEVKTLLLLPSSEVLSGPSSHPWTPLHLAAYHDSANVVRMLLASPGAAIDPEDSEGWTPLHVACFRHNHKTIKLLLLSGASFTKKVRKPAKGVFGWVRSPFAYSEAAAITPVVPAAVFEELLDDCIQLEQESNHHIEYDYSLLRVLNREKQEVEVPEDLEAQREETGVNDGIVLIHSITNASPDHKKLVKHPVVENFLLHKWNKWNKVILVIVLHRLLILGLLAVIVAIEFFPEKTNSVTKKIRKLF